MRFSLWISSIFVILLLSSGIASAQIKSLVPTEGTLGPTSAIEQAADHSTTVVGGDEGQCSFKYGNMHFSCIIPYVGYLLKVVIFMGGGLALFTIILAGYKMVVGGAFMQTQVEEGKRTLIRALTGFSILVLSYFIVDTVIRALT